MTEASAELPDPALRAALFEDAVGVLHERRVAPIVELCRAAGPQILKMRTAKKGNTMLHLATSAVIAEVLLCLGADVLALNADGQTPREFAAPDNVELIAVLRAAEQDSLRRAPAVPSDAAVALAAAEGDDVQVLELLRQTLRSAEASATAERCAQLWSSLEGRQLVSAELHFDSAGLTPPRAVAASPAAVLLSDDGCPPAQVRAQATPELEAVQHVQTMMARTVEVIEGLVAEDRAARDQARFQQEQLHASIMQAAQSFAQMQAFAREASSKSVEPSAVGTRLDAQSSLVAPELVRQSASPTAASSTPGTTEQAPDSGSDANEYDDLDDAFSKITTGGAEQEGQNENGANPAEKAPITTAPPTALATQADNSNLEHWFAVDPAAQDPGTIEAADVSPAAMIPGTATGVYIQLASECAGVGGTGDDSELSAANSEQRPPTEVQNDKTAAAAVAKLDNLTFQKEPQLSGIKSQQENSPPPTLDSTAARDTGTDPPATDTLVASKPRAADAREVELSRHERKALIEQHKRVKMVQTMFDKYARRDERSPAGAMGRKELSQLSKDSGSARIDSGYFRDTCEALRADPEVGILSEHLAQLYLDGGAWSATLVSDYKKIFGTKRVKVIAPPVTARPDNLNAFVAGSNDDLDDV